MDWMTSYLTVFLILVIKLKSRHALKTTTTNNEE